jgi:SAM-dependent methyltransferase
VPTSLEMRAARAAKTAKATVLVDRSMKILEIGPSYAPIAPKSDGWQTYSLDHAPQSELREKYDGLPHIDIEDIEPVDFVWSGGALSTAVPVELHGGFDVCIASHVLEHIPDPINWLSDISRLIKPGGILSLVLPDKRFELDCLRPLSTTGNWLDARGRTKHTRGTLYDCGAYTVTNDGQAFWGQKRFGNIVFYSDFVHALSYSQKADGEGYIDAHAWCFTPASFRLIMLELYALELLPFKIAAEPPPTDFEFYSSWRNEWTLPHPTGKTNDERMSLLKEIQLELRAQIEYMTPTERRETTPMTADLNSAQRTLSFLKAKFASIPRTVRAKFARR